MNLDDLHYAMDGNRQMGNTTALVKACKEGDGILICADEQHRRHVEGKYGIKTLNVQRMSEFRGRGPHLLFIDNHAVGILCWVFLKRLRQHAEVKRLLDSWGTYVPEELLRKIREAMR